MAAAILKQDTTGGIWMGLAFSVHGVVLAVGRVEYAAAIAVILLFGSTTDPKGSPVPIRTALIHSAIVTIGGLAMAWASHRWMPPMR